MNNATIYNVGEEPMIRSVRIDLKVDRTYGVVIENEDGTSGGRTRGLSNIHCALAEAARIIAIYEEINAPNPTPGQMARGGRKLPEVG